SRAVGLSGPVGSGGRARACGRRMAEESFRRTSLARGLAAAARRGARGARALARRRARARSANDRGRQRAHARSRAPCVAGYVDRDTPEDACRRARLQCVSERRAPSAPARRAAPPLSRSAAEGDARDRRAYRFLAEDTALRVPVRARAA